jgi:hypothetical protein
MVEQPQNRAFQVKAAAQEECGKTDPLQSESIHYG